ncbi:MAG TPA: Stp1/IreP family PP2C-type Ser/Thr phosphatase [Chloroflexota bacterium]|nr:Stp1/IreP family PP2C-type Ser/Thr phosphatase [Chloroflexota bacterium]
MIVVGCATDQGRIRPNNEDCYASLGPPAVVPGLDSVLVVADGMGGHQAGEIASRIVVDWVLDWYGDGDKTVDAVPERDWAADLAHALREANRAVRRAASQDPHRYGMGSTVVVCLIEGDRLFVGNVGDSRAYLIDGDEAYQLSRDHSWVAEQVRAGLLAASAAPHHPQRNLLTRALGAADDVEPDVRTFELIPGEYLLLCTDGLYNLVRNHEFARFVQEYREPAVIAKKLIEVANKRGAPDNVTVVIAQYSGNQG